MSNDLQNTFDCLWKDGKPVIYGHGIGKLLNKSIDSFDDYFASIYTDDLKEVLEFQSTLLEGLVTKDSGIVVSRFKKDNDYIWVRANYSASMSADRKLPITLTIEHEIIHHNYQENYDI